MTHPLMAFMAYPSKEALLKALHELKDAKPELLHLLGYEAEDGTFKALRAEDIR